jgi:hypothetical protein
MGIRFDRRKKGTKIKVFYFIEKPKNLIEMLYFVLLSVKGELLGRNNKRKFKKEKI